MPASPPVDPDAIHPDAASFAELVRRRRMVRRFDPDQPVSRAQLESWLYLATRAPSAGFSQGWQFVVFDHRPDIDLYWSLTAGDGPDDTWLAGLRTAPVLVLVLADPSRYRDRYAAADKRHSSLSLDPDAKVEGPDGLLDRWPVAWWDVDAGMAALILLLAATADGFGGCLFGIPDPAWDGVRERFDLPVRWHPVGVVALGQPVRGIRRRRRVRRPLDEVVRYVRAEPPEQPIQA